MSSIVNSFVNDKLHNDQLVYDFVRRNLNLKYIGVFHWIFLHTDGSFQVHE